MGRGQISNLLMELAGIDIDETLKFLITNGRKVLIHCAFGGTSGPARTAAAATSTR